MTSARLLSSLLLSFGLTGGGSACKSQPSDLPEAPPSTTCPESAERPVNERWPTNPVPQGDGTVWDPYICIPDGSGGVIFIQNQPPALKPMRTRLSGSHVPGQLSLTFAEGFGIAYHGGEFVSLNGSDIACIERVEENFDDEFESVEQVFPGDRAEMQRERFELMASSGRFLADRSLFFIRHLDHDADIAAIADAYNRCPQVRLAEPVGRTMQEGF